MSNIVKFIVSFVIISTIALFFVNAFAAVRFNQYTGLWEGNICMTRMGWAYVDFRPIGSYCSVNGYHGQIIGK